MNQSNRDSCVKDICNIIITWWGKLSFLITQVSRNCIFNIFISMSVKSSSNQSESSDTSDFSNNITVSSVSSVSEWLTTHFTYNGDLCTSPESSEASEDLASVSEDFSSHGTINDFCEQFQCPIVMLHHHQQ